MNCDLVSTSIPSQYTGAYYYANVFGASLTATEDVPFDKVCHAVNVLYQYLDNDGDGNCDDERLCEELTNNDALLSMSAGEDRRRSLRKNNRSDRKRRTRNLNLMEPREPREKTIQSYVSTLLLNKLQYVQPHSRLLEDDVPDDAVTCPGTSPGQYCDCGGDCYNEPDWCSCTEAVSCCSDSDGGDDNGDGRDDDGGEDSGDGRDDDGGEEDDQNGNGDDQDNESDFIFFCCGDDEGGDDDEVRDDDEGRDDDEERDDDGGRDDDWAMSFDEGQPLYAYETHPDSCAYPSNRASGDCNPEYDASLEEILHMITSQGLQYVYRDTFGENADSEVGRLLFELNGDCGWGYTGDWIDPSSGNCSGFYAYNDETCDEECLVAEGIYWALTSILDTQNYSDRIDYISNEWLLYTSDLVETNAPDLYSLLTDKASHPWLPTNLPEPYLG